MTEPFELLIDADILLYKSAIASELEMEWEEDIWSLIADHSIAKEIFNAQLTDLIHLSGCSLYTLCFSGQNNYRKDLAPYYKSNRKGKRKPTGYLKLKEWAMDEGVSNEAVGRAMLEDNIEGDDLIGILATEPNPKYPRVIYSEDKDLNNIPGRHFKMSKKDEDVHVLFLTISAQESYKNFLTQVLMGDSTDGYSGVKGIGAVRAKKILDEQTSWRTVVSTYLSSGMTEKDAIETARLAWILQWDDFDFKTGKVNLWHPKRNMKKRE